MKQQQLTELGLNHLQTFRSGLELFGIEEELYILFTKIGEDDYEVCEESKSKLKIHELLYPQNKN